MSFGLGISGYGTQALQQLPTIQVPDDTPIIKVLDLDLSALLLYQVAYQMYQQELSTVDPGKTRITEITPSNQAVQIAPPDSSRIGFSIENTSGVSIYVGFEPEVSATRALKKYNPGEMFGFDGRQCASALYVVGDVPASVISQGFAFYEYFNSSPTPPVPPTLINNNASVPSSNGGLAASVSPTSISAAAGNQAVAFQFPSSFAGQAVTCSLIEQASGRTITTWRDAISATGTLNQDSTNWYAAGAVAGNQLVLQVADASGNKASSPVVAVTA